MSSNSTYEQPFPRSRLAKSRDIDYGGRVIRVRFVVLPAVVGIFLATAGCGGFVARRMVQAPNTYPSWVAPNARVELAFNPRVLTNFTTHQANVGPPMARLTYRIIDPANYGLEITSTHWSRHGRAQFKFSFEANVPGEPNASSQAPRGTVVLLHGYGLAQFSTTPWALRLAQDGWRCILLNLRGHGTSTGKSIYFGLVETNDLSQLLDTLDRRGQLIEPVEVLGDSYGASLALRWKSVEPRVDRVVAISPYARLSDAILNIRREYASYVPKCLIKAGLTKLPSLLKVGPGELDTLAVLTRHPVEALFVAAVDDRITPAKDVRRLRDRADARSRLLVVPGATHEALLYFFDDLVPPTLDWFDRARDSVTQTNPAPDSASP